MRKTLLLLTSIILFPAFLPAAPRVIDNFNSHVWYGPDYGAEWRLALLSWVTFNGRKCLKETSTDTSDWMPMRTKTFPIEDWQTVDLIRADVYLVCNSSNTVLKLEPKAQGGSSIQTVLYNNVSTGTWVDVVWDVNLASPVAWLSLVQENLGTNECTYYFDNLRLIKDGTTYYWDIFDSTENWSTSGSTVTWNNDNPGVVSNVSNSTSNPGAGYLQWQFNGTNQYAQLGLAGLNDNWASYDTLSADVWCSSAAMPLNFYLVYNGGSTGAESSADRYVSSPETWQNIKWSLPPGTTAWNVTEFKIGVVPSALIPSGTYYVDNVTLSRRTLTIVKSTSTASAKPGESITITITYSNPGDSNADNVYITEAIPYNTYLASDPGHGNANTVEFYVGSTWQSVYDPSATKIRWKDNSIAAGDTTNQQVSYSVNIR